ncbi:MAG: YwaF family protein [Clostridia bacterium]|nr:YwaF family protein [Clostridia bacterium]
MKFFKTIIELFDKKMPEPQMFGWFHLLWIALMIIAAVVLCRTHKNGDDKRVRRVVFVTAVLVTVFEIYKQICFSFTVVDDEIVFDYLWYAFPFQFCSMPLYVGLLTGVFRKGKVHNALMAFLATYSIFGGLTVMAYPPQVFIGEIGINIQTMFCHASMIVVGIYLLYTNYVKVEHKTILKAFPVFVVSIALAMLMNEIAKWTGLLEREEFNMFYISPHCEGTLPVYSILQGILPYPVCLVIYFVCFTLIAYLILLAAIGIKKLAAKREKKNG